MNSSRVLALTRALTRGVTTNAPRNQVEGKIARLRENQKKFGVDDGTPVYIKGGAGDKMLFGATVLLIASGLGLSLETFYTLTFRDAK